MKMKSLYTGMLIGMVFMFTACSVDPTETLPGTWSTSDGGTITFNGDGSGITTGSDYFEFDCGSLNGVRIGPITKFTWEVNNNGSNDNLRLEYADPVGYPNCAGSSEFPIEFSGENKATVGVSVLGLGSQVDLTR